MNAKNRQRRLLILTTVLTILFVGSVPGLAKSSKHEKKPASSSSSVEVIHMTGTTLTTGRRDDRPGPAWRTISVTAKQMTADTYTVEDYEGNQVQLYVGKEPSTFGATRRSGVPYAQKSRGAVSRTRFSKRGRLHRSAVAARSNTISP